MLGRNFATKEIFLGTVLFSNLMADALGGYSIYQNRFDTFKHTDVVSVNTVALVLLLVCQVSIALMVYRLRVAAGQNARHRLYLERAADAVLICDPRGRVIDVSQAFCSMLGYRRDELIGSDRSQWALHDAAVIGSVDARLWNREEPITFESTYRHKNGQTIPVEIRVSMVTTSDGRYVYAAAREISERIRIRAELDTELKRFEAIFKNNPVPLLMTDFDTRVFLDVNLAWERLYGLKREAVIGRTGADLGLWLSSENREEFFASFDENGWIGPLEVDVPRGDGTLLSVSIRGRVIALDRQRLFIAAFEDIAARKASEVGLRMTASVFECCQEGIMVTDDEDHIVEINPAFTRITGYSRAESLGRMSAFIANDYDPSIYAGVIRHLATEDGWFGEFLGRRKTGETYPIMAAVSVIRDSREDIQRYVTVFSDISRLKQHEAELERVAHFDALTGLPNRRLLQDRMSQAIVRAHRNDSVLAVCFVDLDGFKDVNDRLGHQGGDRLLIAVSQRIQAVLRSDDTLARLGGDEFVILLNDTGSDATCFQVLDRVLESVREAAADIDSSIIVSGSIGVTLFPTDDSDPDTLLRHADQAMYRAKEAGKGRFHKFDPEHDRQVRASHEALQRLTIALERREFVLHYQPKVNMVTGVVIGTEELIRWRHPERGLVGPVSFLPALVGTELEIAVGDYVFDAALAQLDEWRARGLTLPISVNVSANHLQMPLFAERLQAHMSRYRQISPGQLEIEIVESTAINDIKRATTTIDACRRIGVHFALDDFGTGYSSLTYLRKLPVDMLKIDQSFVRDMLNQPDDLGVIGSVVHLARAFNRTVIAEGVETRQHGALLVKLGCHLGQGYGIAPPMPAEAMEDWIGHWQGSAGWRFPVE